MPIDEIDLSFFPAIISTEERGEERRQVKEGLAMVMCRFGYKVKYHVGAPEDYFMFEVNQGLDESLNSHERRIKG